MINYKICQICITMNLKHSILYVLIKYVLLSVRGYKFLSMTNLVVKTCILKYTLTILTFPLFRDNFSLEFITLNSIKKRHFAP